MLLKLAVQIKPDHLTSTIVLKLEDLAPLMRKNARLNIGVFLVFVITPIAAQADAIVVSQAMFASTIAEYFVEEDHVRVELEIGAADVNAFRNLMPDKVYRDMGFGAEPFAQRIADFFNRDLAIYVDDTPLAGAILDIGPETRVVRDPVTGEVLLAGGEEPEIVIAATLIYQRKGPTETTAQSDSGHTPCRYRRTRQGGGEDRVGHRHAPGVAS